MSSSFRWSILAFALLGLGLSAGSSWVHYRLLTDPTYVTPCDISSTFNCSQVYLSRFGAVWGVPVALGGLIWFGLVGLIAAFARPSVGKSVAGGYVFALATIGLGVILYLGYASFIVLGTGCLLCIGTYVCVLAIFALASLTNAVSVGDLPARLSGDLRRIVTTPVLLAAAVLYLAGTVSAVAFFPDEASVAARAPAAVPTGDASADFARAWAEQPRLDLGIPADGAKVVVVKFNDFECPGCRVAEQTYKAIFEKFAVSNPGAIRYVMKDWPWNSSCNVHTTTTFTGHEAACDAAVAARVARERGKGDEMVAWLFANQGTTKEAVREAAAKIAGVTDFDRESALKLPDVRRDVADGGVLKINSTPTYFINGVRLPTDAGLMAPNYFELAISLELKNAAQ